ncbi:MAG: hypothetical protein O7D91_14655 [Planctomycetota bacterium]|nr:hypothetical protein [Planctomycetota bacterium]
MVEVIISMVVVGGMTVAALNTVGAAKLGSQKITSRNSGTLLAQQLMAEILTQGYAEPVGAPVFGLEPPESASLRTDYDDVDDYDTWSASPPQYKDGTVIPDLDGWARHVTVAWVTATDLSVTSGSETNVKRITVTVTYNGMEVASLTAVRTLARDYMENR